jgi:hypothetical protein
MNPPIPAVPCFLCGKITNETQSVFGVGCMPCYKKEAQIRNPPKCYSADCGKSIAEIERAIK